MHRRLVALLLLYGTYVCTTGAVPSAEPWSCASAALLELHLCPLARLLPTYRLVLQSASMRQIHSLTRKVSMMSTLTLRISQVGPVVRGLDHCLARPSTLGSPDPSSL